MLRKQNNISNPKQHYRLYKKGKNWVTVMITVGTIGLAGVFASQSQAHADTNENTTTSSNVNTSSASSSNTNVSNNVSSNISTSSSSNTNTSSSNTSTSSSSNTNTSSSNTSTSSSSNTNTSDTPVTVSVSSVTYSSASTTSDANTDTNTLSVASSNSSSNTSADDAVDLDASMLRDGDASDSIAAGTWGTANWNLANDGTLTLENGDLQTPAHPQALNNVASQVTHIKTINVKAPVFAGGLFAANKNGDFNGTFGNYVTNSHPGGDGFVNVQSIDVSGLDTSDTTNMNRMFDTDDKLTTIYGFNTLNTDKVTDARFMFVGAHVQYLDLSHFNMQALTNTQKPLVSIVDANGNVSYTEDSPGMYGWDPQVGMFAGAKIGSVKLGTKNNIQTPDFYTNNGDHLVDQNGNQVTNNDQLLAIANSSNPTTYSTSVHNSLAGLIGNIQNLQTSFANRYNNGDGVASGASVAASMAETAVGIDPTTYNTQVSSFDSVATLQTLLAQSPMYHNVRVDPGNNDQDDYINSGVSYLQNSGANSLAALAQAQYAQYKSDTIDGISSANSAIDSISSQAVSYNNLAFNIANDTDKMANNFRFINEINKEKSVGLALQSNGNMFLSQAHNTIDNGKALVASVASASVSAAQSATADKQNALNSAQSSAQNVLNSAQTSAQNALNDLQTSANSTNSSLVNSATSQSNSINSSAASHVANQSFVDSQSADSRANSITQSLQSSATSQIASQSTTDSSSADSRANSLINSLESSANSHITSQSTTDSNSADSRATSLDNSANSHIASQSVTDSSSADSRANSLAASADSHVASQSVTDSSSADSRANSITQSLQSSAASHIASQSATDSQSAESVYSNLINSATIALNGLTSSANSAKTSLANSASSQHTNDNNSASDALAKQKAADDAAYQKLYHQLINAQYQITNLKQAKHALKQGYRPLIKLNQDAKLISSMGIKHLTVNQHPVLKLHAIKALAHHKLQLKVSYHNHVYQMVTKKTGFTYAYYNETHISKQNPLKLKVLQPIKEYKQTKFANPVKTFHTGDTLSVVKMANSKGVARFQLSNGHYVTANKYFVAIK